VVEVDEEGVVVTTEVVLVVVVEGAIEVVDGVVVEEEEEEVASEGVAIIETSLIIHWIQTLPSYSRIYPQGLLVYVPPFVSVITYTMKDKQAFNIYLKSLRGSTKFEENLVNKNRELPNLF